MHVEVRPPAGPQRPPHLLEIRGARQRRQDREAGLKQLVPLDERPEALEVRLAPCRIDDEVAGDAVVEAHARRRRPAPFRPRSRPCAGRRALRWSPPRGRRRCRSPCASGRHASSSSGCRATRSDAALHQDPLLADAAAPQLARQLEAARRVVPEQIVGDEHVIADRREVAAHGVDRPLADGARVDLPDRAEGAAERAAARRLDELGRAVREARILAPPRLHVMPRRQRHLVERQRADLSLGPDARRRRDRDSARPGTVVSGTPRSSASQIAGIARSPSSSTTAVDRRHEKRLRDRRRPCVRRR